MPLTITVHNFDLTHKSTDAGKSWQETKRIVPPINAPYTAGIATLQDIPFEKESVCWDHLHILRDGFGVAVNHELTCDRKFDVKSKANIYLTQTNSTGWQYCEPKISIATKILNRIIGPIERIHSLLVSDAHKILLGWEDPWIMDRSKTRIITSCDEGKTWKYKTIGRVLPDFYMDVSDNIYLFNKDNYLVSRNFGQHWDKAAFQILIEQPAENTILSLIYNVVFIEDYTAFALINEFDKSHMSHPKNIILIKTEDRCSQWEIMARFAVRTIPGWNNPLHAISLQIDKQ